MQAAGSSGSQCDTSSAPAGADVESSAQASTAAKTARQSDGRLLGPPLINSVASPLRARAAYHRICSLSAAEWENGLQKTGPRGNLEDDGPLGRPGARV